jgi:hypothetical protein
VNGGEKLLLWVLGVIVMIAVLVIGMLMSPSQVAAYWGIAIFTLVGSWWVGSLILIVRGFFD